MKKIFVVCAKDFISSRYAGCEEYLLPARDTDMGKGYKSVSEDTYKKNPYMYNVRNWTDGDFYPLKGRTK